MVYIKYVFIQNVQALEERKETKSNEKKSLKNFQEHLTFFVAFFTGFKPTFTHFKRKHLRQSISLLITFIAAIKCLELLF